MNDNAEAIAKIEEHLEKLKNNMAVIMMNKGQDPLMMEELSEKYKLEGNQEYEKFINDKSRFDSKTLIIQAYEEILRDKRTKEREVLNKQRFKEYEKNRPPQSNWYELKTGEFSKELYRNRMALKPNNSNSVYLQIL